MKKERKGKVEDLEQNNSVRWILIAILILALILIVLLILYYGFNMQTIGNVIYNSGNYSGIEFAPPFDVFNNNKLIFNITPEYVSGNSINIDVQVNHAGAFIYKKAYYYNQTRWIEFNLTGNVIGNSNWISGPASKTIPIPSSQLRNGSNFIAAYSCKKYNNNWECGCDNFNQSNCGQWMLQIFNFSSSGVGGGSGDGGSGDGGSGPNPVREIFYAVSGTLSPDATGVYFEDLSPGNQKKYKSLNDYHIFNWSTEYIISPVDVGLGADPAWTKSPETIDGTYSPYGGSGSSGIATVTKYYTKYNVTGILSPDATGVYTYDGLCGNGYLRYKKSSGSFYLYGPLIGTWQIDTSASCSALFESWTSAIGPEENYYAHSPYTGTATVTHL